VFNSCNANLTNWDFWIICKQVNKIRNAGGLRSSAPQRDASEIRMLFTSESGFGRPCQGTCAPEVVALLFLELECWRANIADGENSAPAVLIQTPSGLLNGTNKIASLAALTYKLCFYERLGRSFIETGLTLNIQMDHVVLYANQRIQQPSSTLPGLMVAFRFLTLICVMDVSQHCS
jgi:hypothetical protein